jgi:hypothetical protein
MGSQCCHVHFSDLSHPVPLKSSHKNPVCDKCRRWYGETIRATGKAAWVRHVLEAIEAVLGLNQASLWHLFELHPHNGGEGKPSDRGECLNRLGAKTLTKTKHWLDQNEEEAEKRYGRNRFIGLRAHVALFASLSSLPPDRLLLPEQHSPILPLEGMIHTRSGRAKDLTIPIKVQLLRQRPRYTSERELAKELGIPRSTLRGIRGRMEEVNFSSEKFTPEELEYVALGEIRGPKRKA